MVYLHLRNPVDALATKREFINIYQSYLTLKLWFSKNLTHEHVIQGAIHSKS